MKCGFVVWVEREIVVVVGGMSFGFCGCGCCVFFVDGFVVLGYIGLWVRFWEFGGKCGEG